MSGNRAHSLRGYLADLTPRRRTEWLANLLHAHLPRLDLGTSTITNLSENLRSPLQFRFEGSARRFARASGSRLFFNPNFINRLEPDNIPGDETIQEPYFQDYRYHEADTLRISFPGDYVLEASTDTTHSFSPGVTYSARSTLEGPSLTYTRTMREEEIEVPVETFRTYVSGLQSVANWDRARIVLRRDTDN